MLGNKHLNGNLLCALDIETTGLIVGENEILEIAVVPLTNDYQPNLDRGFFHMMLRPLNADKIDMEAIRIHKRPDNNLDYSKLCVSTEQVLKCVNQGVDPYKAADLFIDWFERLKLAPFKRIMPLGHNILFDLAFIKEWLGPASMDYVFDPRYRDSQVVSLFMNDVDGYRNEPQYSFAKNNLQYLCSQLNVTRLRSHNAFDDAIATAECYARMCKRFF